MEKKYYDLKETTVEEAVEDVIATEEAETAEELLDDGWEPYVLSIEDIVNKTDKYKATLWKMAEDME